MRPRACFAVAWRRAWYELRGTGVGAVRGFSIRVVHGEGHRRRHVEQLETALEYERHQLGILGIDETLRPAQEDSRHLVSGDELPATVVNAHQLARVAFEYCVLCSCRADGLPACDDTAPFPWLHLARLSLDWFRSVPFLWICILYLCHLHHPRQLSTTTVIADPTPANGGRQWR